jgi:hypothetical protein
MLPSSGEGETPTLLGPLKELALVSVFSIYLEFRMIDEVQKPSGSEEDEMRRLFRVLGIYENS